MRVFAAIFRPAARLRLSGSVAPRPAFPQLFSKRSSRFLSTPFPREAPKSQPESLRPDSQDPLLTEAELEEVPEEDWEDIGTAEKWTGEEPEPDAGEAEQPRDATEDVRLLHKHPKRLKIHKNKIPPRPKVSEDELIEKFLRGSGPGGQKINKTSSAVQIKHIPTGIVVKSQATRSRTENRKIARRILAERLEIMEKGSESRVEMKRELKKRRKASRAKKSKRKYRRLEEEKRNATIEQDHES